MGRTSDDLHFGKTFSWPLSKKDILVKAEDIAKKQQGTSTSISQLVVNLVTEFVERNEAIESNAVNPLNIRYHSSIITTTNIDINTQKYNKLETLDEALDLVNEILYGFMTDHKDTMKHEDFTRIEACLIQLQKYASKGYFESRRRKTESHYHQKSKAEVAVAETAAAPTTINLNHTNTTEGQK